MGNYTDIQKEYIDRINPIINDIFSNQQIVADSADPESYRSKKNISREDAISMLYGDMYTGDSICKEPDDRNSIFDKYGNYNFPNDFVLQSPNNAYGMYCSEEYSVRKTRTLKSEEYFI